MLIIYDKDTKKYLAWAEMQPIWVDDINAACDYTNTVFTYLLNDIQFLKDRGFNIVLKEDRRKRE